MGVLKGAHHFSLWVHFSIESRRNKKKKKLFSRFTRKSSALLWKLPNFSWKIFGRVFRYFILLLKCNFNICILIFIFIDLILKFYENSNRRCSPILWIITTGGPILIPKFEAAPQFFFFKYLWFLWVGTSSNFKFVT